MLNSEILESFSSSANEMIFRKHLLMSSSVFAQHMGAACAPILSCAPDVGSVAHVDLEIFKSQTLLSSTWASQGRKFQNWNAWSVERSKECAYRMGASLLCSTATISWFFIPAPSFVKVGPSLISSDLIASQLLLEIAHCTRSPQSASSHPISSHLISSHVFSPCLSFSQLITTVLISSYVIWAFLVSSQLISKLFFFELFSASSFYAACVNSVLLRSSQLINALLMSSRLNSSNLISFQLISALLKFFQLFSSHFLLMSAHLMSSHPVSLFLSSSNISALLSFCQLLSPYLSS